MCKLLQKFTDQPSIPWSDGRFHQASLFEDRHTQRLAWLLYSYQPELLQRWYQVVLRSAIRAEEEDRILRNILAKREDLAASIADEILAPSLSLSRKFKEFFLKPSVICDSLLALGLSFMLFLGISEYLGIEVQSITADRWLLVGLAIAAAICLTLAAKQAIIKWVKATRYYEPKRSFSDDRRYANLVPFWLRLQRGDAAVWLTVLVVLFEMMFAAPGLIGFLPPRLAVQPLFQISAFVATGLAALVNAFLAWGTALEQIRLEWEAIEDSRRQATALESPIKPQETTFEVQTTPHKMNLEAKAQQEIEAERRQIQKQAIEAKAKLRVVQKQIEEQRRVFSDARWRAIAEHKRWEKAVRRWLRSHPEILEQLSQFPSPLDRDFPQPLADSGIDSHLKLDTNAQKPLRSML